MCKVMNCFKSVSVILFLSLFLGIHSQVDPYTLDPQFVKELLCIEYEHCGSCMSAPAGCRWCADPYFNKGQPRCNSYDKLLTSGCSQGLIQRPEPDVYEVVDDHPLQDMVVGGEEVVQIIPQRVHISLRPGQTKKIKFTYRPAKNYPLDLYYLMDLSYSMKDDKDTLVSLRDDLPTLLKNLTDNYKLGFGSFADKPLMPYTSMDEKRRKNPCVVEEQVCEATYAFHHQLSLTDEVNEFIDKVNGSRVTANIDNAEGQLDALMQVLVCGERIGWSHQSRKIVILLTDGSLHTAGDGLLGGAVKRNDGECHMDIDGYYSGAETYDYPSISQIYKLLDFYKVNVIFAITENLMEYYNNVHRVLDKFTFIAKLENDSSNILKLVKKGYDDIVSVINFKDDIGEGALNIKYLTNCGDEDAPVIETTMCTDVEFGKTVNFEVYISLDECVEFVKMQRTVNILESQLGRDTLKVDIDLQCGCECDNNMETLHEACFINSRLVCGVCQCDQGWSGPSCNCSIGDEETSASLVGRCRDPKEPNKQPCFGRGDCDCGICTCDKGYHGKFCHCTDCPINLDGGKACGGLERGQCACGKCICNQEWEGDACECPKSTDTCRAPPLLQRDALKLKSESEVCSGRGECHCGKCVCTKKYSGAYCDVCPSCKNSICTDAEPIVLCHADNNCDTIEPITYTNYTFIYNEVLNDTENNDDTRCIVRRDEGTQWCEYQFRYNVVKDNIENKVYLNNVVRVCTETTSAMIMNFGPIIAGGVVLVGLVLIAVFKMYQIQADRRDYEKFKRDADLSLLDAGNEKNQNPLYVSPIVEVKMPEGYPREMQG